MTIYFRHLFLTSQWALLLLVEKDPASQGDGRIAKPIKAPLLGIFLTAHIGFYPRLLPNFQVSSQLTKYVSIS